MKIILPGGTGQLGHLLARAFTRDGHACVVLTRDPTRATANLVRQGLAGAARAVAWDGRTLGPWTAEFEDADVVVNLAGCSVDCRYTEANLARMLTSRTDSTRVVGAAIAAARNPPRVWLNSSTATIYAHAGLGDPPSPSPPRPGCWKSARFSAAPRRNSSSKVAA